MKKRTKTLIIILIWILLIATAIHCVFNLDGTWMSVVQLILVYALYEVVNWLTHLLSKEGEENSH